MRKFSEIQEWKYQKKKKPLVFLQEDIEEREYNEFYKTIYQS